MDVVKIGKFIASCRKEKGYTQAKLAEMLGVTDGAVSKWENGKSMPDSSIMLPLCEILSINVNELLKGENLTMEAEVKVSEELIISLKEMEEKKTRQLLFLEKCTGVIAVVTLVGICGIAFSITSLSNLYSNLLWELAILIMAGYIFIGIWIEHMTGYYQCSECGYIYTAAFHNILKAPNVGRKRKMCCPNCKKINYHKKVMNKEQ